MDDHRCRRRAVDQDAAAVARRGVAADHRAGVEDQGAADAHAAAIDRLTAGNCGVIEGDSAVIDIETAAVFRPGVTVLQGQALKRHGNLAGDAEDASATVAIQGRWIGGQVRGEPVSGGIAAAQGNRHCNDQR